MSPEVRNIQCRRGAAPSSETGVNFLLKELSEHVPSASLEKTREAVTGKEKVLVNSTVTTLSYGANDSIIRF